MTIEAGLYSALVGNSSINSIVSGRVYAMRLPQDPTFPAITYQRISNARGRALSALANNYSRASIQVDSWASSYSEIKQLSEAVRGLLEDYVGTMGAHTVKSARYLGERDDFDPELSNYRVIQEFELWHND